jgi:hypothetical protein
VGHLVESGTSPLSGHSPHSNLMSQSAFVQHHFFSGTSPFNTITKTQIIILVWDKDLDALQNQTIKKVLQIPIKIAFNALVQESTFFLAKLIKNNEL